MLKKSNRLTTKQFLNVMSDGKITNSPLFVMRHTVNQRNIRVSAVAPAKIVKRAVARNRARRRMYEAIKILIPSIIPGVHAIIFSRNDLADHNFESVKKELMNLFVKAQLPK